jgi:heterodisulfide reductase subunit D
VDITPRELAESCVFCSLCIEVCPFFKATGNVKYGAMAKVEAAKELFNGAPPSDEDIKTLLLCTRCDQCHSACPIQLPVADIVQGARNELRRRNMVPEKYNTIAQAIIKSGSPMGTPPEKRLAFIPEGFRPPKTAKYLYVPGCWSGIKLPETAKATVELMLKAGLDFTVLGEREWCCGLFLLDTGMVDEAKKLAESNTELFESTGAECLVTECPSCHDVFKRVYPKLFRAPKYKVIHVSELLKELIDGGKLRVSKPDVPRKIIYKDPCPLVRRHGITEGPRGVISSFAELVEYGDNRENLLCCGAPAGVKPIFPDIANRLAEMLVDEAASRKADEISVGCAFCLYHMGSAGKGPSGNLKIKTLSQQVKEHLLD